MSNNFLVGSYYPVKSKVHFMSPISKILCTLIFIVTTFLCSDPRLMLLLSMLIVLVTEMARLPRRIYFKTFKSLRFVIVFIILIYYLLGTDLETVINMILRAINIVLYTSVLTLTTPPTEITYGLQKVLSPLRILGIRVKKLSLSLTFALRFIPMFLDEGNRILKTQASRGIDYYASGIKGKFLAVKSMLIPMYIQTVHKIDLMAESMQVRLYNINNKRTNFKKAKWGFFDTFLLLIHLGILGLIIARMVI